MNSIAPDWRVPDHVHAFFTTRPGGFSRPPYESLNLGDHVGDDLAVVLQNRRQLDVPSDPEWLVQTHSIRCVDADATDDRDGDAAFTRSPGKVLAVMVADCLPILVASRSEKLVGVIHAGWRGLAEGVIGTAIRAMSSDDLVAWIGPSIGPCHYEVGDDVRQYFAADTGFERDGAKWRMDLKAIASAQLRDSVAIETSTDCTACDTRRFFSYRRDGDTGRMAGIIWMSD